jgi:hypothetical protein
MTPFVHEVSMKSSCGWMSCMPATHKWIWGTMCYKWVRKRCLYGATVFFIPCNEQQRGQTDSVYKSWLHGLPPPPREAVKSQMVQVQGHTLKCNVQCKNAMETTGGKCLLRCLQEPRRPCRKICKDLRRKQADYYEAVLILHRVKYGYCPEWKGTADHSHFQGWPQVSTEATQDEGRMTGDFSEQVALRRSMWHDTWNS